MTVEKLKSTIKSNCLKKNQIVSVMRNTLGAGVFSKKKAVL